MIAICVIGNCIVHQLKKKNAKTNLNYLPVWYASRDVEIM